MELHGQRFVEIKFSGVSDQHLGKVPIDAPVAHLVGVSQGVAGDFAANPHVVKLPASSAQTRLDVPETFAIGELSKGHRQKLVPARKALHFVVAVVAIDTEAKLVGRQKLYQLRKYCCPSIHQPSPSAGLRKCGFGTNSISNR